MDVSVWVCTDRIGSKMMRKMKVGEEEWAEMTDEEKDESVFEFITNSMMIEWGYNE